MTEPQALDVLSDPLMRGSEVAKLRGTTPRGLYQAVHAGKFPQPCARRGNYCYWRRSVVVAALKAALRAEAEASRAE